MGMGLKVDFLADGFGPSEALYAVPDVEAEGCEVCLHKPSVVDGLVPVGWPVAADGEVYVVELPAETTRGSKRVRVRRDDVVRLPALRPDRGWHVRATFERPGLHPSEEIVAVVDEDGVTHRFCLSVGSCRDGKVFVGYPVNRSVDGSWLVQFARESMAGAPALWMKDEDVFPEDEARA